MHWPWLKILLLMKITLKTTDPHNAGLHKFLLILSFTEKRFPWICVHFQVDISL